MDKVKELVADKAKDLDVAEDKGETMVVVSETEATVFVLSVAKKLHTSKV
jgi:hypothetical protein